MLTKEQKQEIIAEYGGETKNTGSTEVQIALLTARIKDLQNHFDMHKKDHHSRTGLLKMIGQRKRLQKYLKRTNLEAYRELIAKLGLRR